MLQSLWTSQDPEAREQRHVFLLGLLNLESGIMSLKLVLMIKFIPLMEPALHGGHWNTERSSRLSARSLVISVTIFRPFFLLFNVSCSFLHKSNRDQTCLQPTASCELNNWEELYLCSTHGRSFQTRSLLTPLAFSSLIIQFLVEVSVTLSLCGLIPGALSWLCCCSYFSSLNPSPPQILSEMDLERAAAPSGLTGAPATPQNMTSEKSHAPD